MAPVSLDTQFQRYMPGMDTSTKHNSQCHPPSLPQYQQRTHHAQATTNRSSQQPPIPVPQPQRYAVQLDATVNRNGQRPPVSVPQYHQYLAQFEAAATQHGQRPSPPSLVTQSHTGHWVRNTSKAYPAYAARHDSQSAAARGQPHQPTSTHPAQQYILTGNRGYTSANRSNNPETHFGQQSTAASQPFVSANGHPTAGPAKNMTSISRGLPAYYVAPTAELTPAMDLRERQAITAGLKRLEMLERSFAGFKEDHTRRLLDLEKKHEDGLVALKANELARYRNAHGLPSIVFREEVGPSVVEVRQAHVSGQSARLPCERNINKSSTITTTEHIEVDKPNVPSHSIGNREDTIELGCDGKIANRTSCDGTQTCGGSTLDVEYLRRRSKGESPKPRAARYNMRTRVKGRVEKPASRGA